MKRLTPRTQSAAGRYAVGLIAAPFLIAGCSLLPARPPAGCPAGGWDAAMVWSSETEPAGDIVFVKGSGITGRQAVPYQGLDPSPDEDIVVTPGEAWIRAKGNTIADRPHMLRYDTVGCSMHAYPITEQLAWSVGVGPGVFYTTNTVNGAAVVRRRTLDGTVAAQASFPGHLFTNLLVHQDHVYAFGSRDDTDIAVLFELDAATLTERRRLTLEGVARVGDAVVLGDALYFTESLIPDSTDMAEGTRLDRLRLPDLQRDTIELGAPAPNQIEVHDGRLYIVHNFMNGGYRDLNEYRTLTHYDPATGGVEHFDLGRGLLTIAVNGQTLHAVTQIDDELPTLTSYRLPQLTPTGSVQITRPPGAYHYVAGILTPPERP